MRLISFWLIYPVIYLFSRLPFGVLYTVSDVLARLFRWMGYRRNVVVNNLRKSFPGKTEGELRMILKAYYQYLMDTILETFKTMAITEVQLRERCVFRQPEWLHKLYQQKQNVLVVMGHYGNWEWASPGFALQSSYRLTAAYRPLVHPYFDRMMKQLRTRFGTRVVAENKILREMAINQTSPTVTAFIADQTASDVHNAYWLTFLHQDTPFHPGPGRLAKRFNYPIVFMSVRRVRRGYYEIVPVLLESDPKTRTEREITELFARALEKEINRDPVTWLWSHRRWKHERPADYRLAQ